MTPPFETCWQRIHRAKTHRDKVGSDWAAFLEEEPYSPSVEVDADGRGSIYVVPRREFLSPIFAIELGEMLYQLRGALDACVYAAAIVESGQEPPPNEEDLEFPIRESPEQFEKAAWHLGPLAQEHRDIVKAIQPYNAPFVPPDVRFINESLGLLNDWARIDRHRRLHVVGSWASRASPALRLPDGVRLVRLDLIGDGFLEHKDKIADFVLEGWKPGMEIEANPNLIIDIAIDELPHPRDDSDTLSERTRLMVVAAEAVVRMFQECFRRRVTEQR